MEEEAPAPAPKAPKAAKPPPPVPESSAPETVRTYYEDTWQFKAEATVADVVVDPADENGGTIIILDGTIFHPQGGGQRSDVGTITCGEATFTGGCMCGVWCVCVRG